MSVYAEDFAGNVEWDFMTASYDIEKPWLDDLNGSSEKLIVAPSGSSGVVMEWGKPRDNMQVSEVSAGIMEYSTDSKWVWSIKGNSLSHTFSSLKPGCTYLLAVRLTDTAGNIKTYQKAFRIGGGDLPEITTQFKELVSGYEVEGTYSKVGDSEAWLLIPDEMDLIVDGNKLNKIQLDSGLVIEEGQFVSGESKKAFTININGLVLKGEGLSLSQKGLVILKGYYKPFGLEKEIVYEDIKLSSPPGILAVKSSVSKEELTGLNPGGFLLDKAWDTTLESNNFTILGGLLNSEKLGCYREVDGVRSTNLPVKNVVVSNEGFIRGGRISGDYFLQTGDNTILIKDGCSFVKDGMIVVNEGEIAIDGKFGSFKIFNFGVSKGGEVNALEGFKWTEGINIKIESLTLKNGKLILEKGNMKVRDAIFISVSNIPVIAGMLDGTTENMPLATWKDGFNVELIKNPWKVSDFKVSLDGQKVGAGISIGNLTDILDGYHDLEQGKLLISSDPEGNLNAGLVGEIKLKGEAGKYFGQFGAVINKCELDSDFNIKSLMARSMTEINDILSENMEIKRGYIDLSYNGEDKTVKINVEGFLNTPGLVNLLTLGNGIKIDSLTISKQGKMVSLEAFSMAGMYDSKTDLDFEKLDLPIQNIDMSSAEGLLSEINDGFKNYFRNTFVKAVLDVENQAIHFEVNGEMVLNSIINRGLDGKKISIREIILDRNGKIASISSQGLLPDKISICGAIELVNGKLSLIPDETGMDFNVLLTGRFKIPDRLKKLQDFYIDAESVIFEKDGKIKELKAGRVIEGPTPFIGKSSLKNAYAGVFKDGSGDMKIEVKGLVILPVNAGDIYSAPLELGIKTFVIGMDGKIEDLELGAELPGTTPFIGISRLKDAKILVSKDDEDNIQAEVSGSLILPGMIDGEGDVELAINRLKIDMDANILEMDIRGTLPEKVNFIGDAVLENCSVGLIKEEDSSIKLDLSGKIKLPEMEVKALSGLELQINSLRLAMDGEVDVVDAVLKLNEDIEFENGIRLKNGTLGIRNEKGGEPEILVGGKLKLPDNLPGDLKGAELDISRCIFEMEGSLKELDASMTVDNTNLMGITTLKDGTVRVVKAPSGGIQTEIGGKIVLPENAPGVLKFMELSINSFRIGSGGEILSFDASASVTEESKIFGDYVKSRNLNIKAYFNESRELEFSIGGQLLFKGESISNEEFPVTINSFVIAKDGTIKTLDLKAEGINTGVFGMFDLSNGMLSVKDDESGENLIDIQGSMRIRDNFPSGLRGKTLIIKNFSISLDGIVRSFEGILADASVFGGFGIKNGRVYLDDTKGEICAGIGGQIVLSQNYPQGIKGLQLDINSFIIKKDGSIKELDIGTSGINAKLFESLLLSNGTIMAQKELDGTVLLNITGNLALSDVFPQSLRSKNINLKKLTLSTSGIKDFEASIDGESSFEFMGGIEVKTNSIGIGKSGLTLSGSLTFPQSYPEGFRGLTLEVSKIEMGWDGEIKEIYTKASQIQIKLAGFVTDIEGLEITKDAVKIGSCILTLPDNMGNMKMGIKNASITEDGKFHGAFITPDIDKEIAGCNLKLKGCSLDIFERRIEFEKAQLKLPSEVGGYTVGLNGVTLEQDGIKFRGGSFRIPSMKVGSALNISNAYLDFKIEGRNDFYIEGGAAITIADIGSYKGIVSFGNRSDEYPIGLRRAEFTFSIPGVGIPIGNSGLYIKTITGGIAFGQPYEIPSEVQGMFKSGMRIKMGVGFKDGSGGSIVDGNGTMWIDLTNCGIATRSNVTVLSGLARGEMVAAITKQGFYGKVGLEMCFARGKVTIYVFKYNGHTNVSGSAKLEIGVREGSIYEKKIGWGWFSFTIKIPPCDFWLGSVNSDFGLFTNGSRGVKAYLSLPWGIGEIGVFVSKNDVDVGGVGSYHIYIPEWAHYSSRKILLASASDKAFAVMPDRNTLTYNFDVGGSDSKNNAMPGRLLFTVAYPEGEPEIVLKSPSGKSYGLDSSNIFVSYHDWGMLLAVLDPEEGQWSLEASNVENKNEFDVQVFGLSKVPKVKIESVGVNGAKATIKGSILNAPAGSKVDIYLSDNAESHNGLPAGTCTVDLNGRYNAEIDLSVFKNGDYYVYAVLLDSDNSPDANSRYEKTIKISLEKSPLKVVTGFIASDDGKGSIDYMFTDVNGQKSAGFKLYLENLTKKEQSVINLGYITSASIPGFDKGDVVNLSVSPYDSDGVEGGKSKTIEIKVGGSKDIKNLFTVEYTDDIYIRPGKSANGIVDILNSQPVETGSACDYAGFEVLEIPDGIDISGSDGLSINQAKSEIKFEIFASNELKSGTYTLKTLVYNKGNRDINREINFKIHVSYNDIVVKNLETRYIVPSDGMELKVHGENFNTLVKVFFGDKELVTEVGGPDLMTVKLPDSVPYGKSEIIIKGPNGNEHKVDFEVLEPSYRLMLSKNKTFILKGKSDAVQVSFKTYNGYSKDILLTINNIPKDWKIYFERDTLKPSETGIMHLEIPENAVIGEYQIGIITDRGNETLLKVEVTEEEHKPFVTKLSINRGTAGDKFKIFGGCFKANGKAYIDDKELTITSFNESVIEVQIPEGTNTGNIAFELDGIKYYGPKFNILTDIKLMVATGEPDGDNGYYRTMPQVELYTMLQDMKTINYSLGSSDYKTYTGRFNIPQGINTLKAYVNDSDGKEISSGSWTIKYDNKAPVTKIVYTDGEVYQKGDVVKIDGKDETSGLNRIMYRYKVGGKGFGPWHSCDGNICINSDETVTIEYYGVDNAGNAEVTKSAKLKYIEKWKTYKEYKRGDLVFWNGKVYRCLVSHKSWRNGQPYKFSYIWVVKIVKTPGKANEWEYQVKWNVGDLVTYKGKTYKCIKEHVALKFWYPDKKKGLFIKIN